MTKRLKYVDGKIEKDNDLCGIKHGHVEARTIEILGDLVPVLSHIDQSQAIAVGVPKINGVDKFEIVLKKHVDRRPGAIARSKECFVFPARTLIPFDHDPHPRCPVPIDGPDDFIEYMTMVDPQFAELGYVRTYSTSSGIYLGDKEIIPAQGFHLYAVGDGNKLSVAREALFMRAFTVDLGYIVFARNGRMLPRTIFDKAVMYPWGLMFEAGAVLEGGIEQRRPPPEFCDGNELKMGRLKVSERLRGAYKKVLKSLRGQAWTESKRIQDKYVEEETQKLVDAYGGEITITQARRTVKSRGQRHTLQASDLLYFDHLDKPVPVSEVMENIDQYKDKTLRDPVEPEVGTNKAYLFKDGSGIWSHLHGGQKYTLSADDNVRTEVRLVGLIEEQCGRLNDSLEDPAVGLYRRGDVCVRTGNSREEKPEKGIERDPNSTRLYVCDVHRFTLTATRTLDFIAVDEFGEERRTDCPDRLARKYLSMAGEWNMPYLRMVTDTPFMREDGVVVTEAGYDPDTGVLMRDPLTVDDVVIGPAEIEKAKKIVLEPFLQFPWIDADNRAVILSLQLSLIQRPVIDCTPLHGIAAPPDAAGTGKGLSIRAAVMGVLGITPSAINVSTNRKDENEKVIESVLLAADRAVVLDNVEDPLQGGKLCSALTEPLVNVRPFHTQDAVECPNVSVWVASGNGLKASGDLARRSIFGVMDAEMEFPYQRTCSRGGEPFKYEGNNLVEHCLAHWVENVWSWLVLLKAYYKSQPSIGANMLGVSFGQWDSWVRRVLVFHGLGNPALTQEQVQADNNERNERCDAFAALYACFGEKEFQVKDIKEHGENYECGLKTPATEYGETFATLWGRGATNSRVLGGWLSDNRNARAVGLMLVHRGTTDGAARWAIEPASDSGV